MNNRSLLLTFLLVVASIANLAYSKDFIFNDKGEFTLLQMTDLHYGENEDIDSKNMAIQDKLLKRAKPDLTMVTGDVVAGYAYNKKKKDFTKGIWDKFTKPFSDNKTPYAFVMGNRDVDGDIRKEEDILKLERSKSYSVLGMSPGYRLYRSFNYNIPVFTPDKKFCPLMIWIFNTNYWTCNGDKSSPGCVDYKQISWFKKRFAETAKFDGNRDAQHIAFVHIPLFEFMNLYNDKEYYGTRNEEIGSPTVNTGIFKALKDAGFTHIFAGHDHLNDFGGKYDGVELVYGRKTGHGGYSWYDPEFQNGGRVIKFKQNKDANGKIQLDVDHYVIVENPETEAGKREESKDFQKALHRRYTIKQDPDAYPSEKSLQVGTTNTVKNVMDKVKSQFGVLIGLLLAVGMLILFAKFIYPKLANKYQGYGKLKYKSPLSYEMKAANAHMA